MKPSWRADTYQVMTTGWTTQDGRKVDQIAYTHAVSGSLLDHAKEDDVRALVLADFHDKAHELGAVVDSKTIEMHWLDPRYPGTVMMERF